MKLCAKGRIVSDDGMLSGWGFLLMTQNRITIGLQSSNFDPSLQIF